MNRTDIEYLDFTWNPLAMRCSPVSSGCVHCWHLRMCNRMAANPVFPQEAGDAYAGISPPVLVESRLTEPLKRRKPARIGVQFMGDLFHEDVPAEFICDVWLQMTRCQKHTFIILTKRPERMQDWIKRSYGMGKYEPPPLPNLWLGVTIEKPEYSYRADYLRQCPAAVRFLSLEPLLGSFAGYPGVLDDMDLVIAGAETGPGARPMDLDWARGLRDQCQEAGVPFFFKRDSNGSRLLDGREWNECPARRGEGDDLLSSNG